MIFNQTIPNLIDTSLDEIVDKTIINVVSPVATVRQYAFFDCKSMITASFPNCTSVGDYAFAWCTIMESIYLPVCTIVGVSAFVGCFSLNNVNLPNCITVSKGAFEDCRKLTTISLPACQYLGNYAFSNCANLSAVNLTGSSVVQLANSNVFYNAFYQGSIYVPASLLTSYQNDAVWSWYSTKFVGV